MIEMESFLSDPTDPATKLWKEIMDERKGSPTPLVSEALYAAHVAQELRTAREAYLAAPTDVVEMPSHYTQLPVECIDVTEHFNFTLGNAIKYIWRADHKGKPLEDLRKARWYIDREIARREAGRE